MIAQIAVLGAGGRMGRSLTESIFAASWQDKTKLTAAIVPQHSPLIGTDIGSIVLSKPVDVVCTDNITDVIEHFDVLIDFTTPEISLQYLKICQKYNKALVLGTTGFTIPQRKEIAAAAQHIPIVYAANMSIGINLLLGLVHKIAAVLSEQADVEIIEAHHKHKKDAPSGTALAIGEAIAQAQGTDLQNRAVYTRHGNDIGARAPGSIGFSTIRAGDIIGEHTALFALANERLEITHKASSRRAFADGAVHAAHWLIENHHTQGLFSMQQVLGF